MKNLEVQLVKLDGTDHQHTLDVLRARLKPRKSIKWKVRTSEGLPEKGSTTDYYMVPLSNDALNDLHQLKKLRARVGDIGRIVAIGAPNQLGNRYFQRALHFGYVDAFLDNDDITSSTSWHKFLNKVNQDHPQKYTIGLFGLGDLGKAIVWEILYNSDFNVVAGSKHFSSKRDDIQGWLESYTPYGRVRFVARREEVMESAPDVVIIANGRHPKNIDLEAIHNPRDYLAQFSFLKLHDNYRVLEGFKGFVIDENNPPGPQLFIASEEYGLDPRKLTSIGADAARIRDAIFEQVRLRDSVLERVLHGEIDPLVGNLEPSDVHVPVFGVHGSARPYLRGTYLKRYSSRTTSQWSETARKGGINLMELLPQLNVLDPTKEIFEFCDAYGDRSLKASRSLNLGFHRATAISILRTLKDLARGDGHLSDPVYCYYDQKKLAYCLEKTGGISITHGSFMFSPALVRNGEIEPDPLMKLKDADEEVRSRITHQYLSESNMIRQYYKKFSLKNHLRNQRLK